MVVEAELFNYLDSSSLFSLTLYFEIVFGASLTKKLQNDNASDLTIFTFARVSGNIISEGKVMVNLLVMLMALSLRDSRKLV